LISREQCLALGRRLRTLGPHGLSDDELSTYVAARRLYTELDVDLPPPPPAAEAFDAVLGLLAGNLMDPVAAHLDDVVLAVTKAAAVGDVSRVVSPEGPVHRGAALLFAAVELERTNLLWTPRGGWASAGWDHLFSKVSDLEGALEGLNELQQSPSFQEAATRAQELLTRQLNGVAWRRAAGTIDSQGVPGASEHIIEGTAQRLRLSFSRTITGEVDVIVELVGDPPGRSMPVLVDLFEVLPRGGRRSLVTLTIDLARPMAAFLPDVPHRIDAFARLPEA
jgi:hypothetical protein